MLKKVLLLLGVLGVLAYLGLCLLVYSVQRALVFPSPKALTEPRAGFTATVLPGAGGAYLASTPLRDVKTVFWFHGNGEQAADVTDVGARLVDLGYQVVVVEYPGYPLLANAPPGEQESYAAAHAALTDVIAKAGLSPENIVLLGQSLGSGIAVEMAGRVHAPRLVLLTPYTRLPDVAKRQFWFLPVTLLMKDVFDSASKAPALTAQTLVIHGTDDEVIPFSMGQELQSKVPHSEFMAVSGGRHNGLWLRPEVFEAVVKFIGPPTPPPEEAEEPSTDEEVHSPDSEPAEEAPATRTLKTDDEAIAAYTQDCGATLNARYSAGGAEDRAGDECTLRDADPKEDPFACTPIYTPCADRCGTDCSACRATCTTACTDCKSRCADSDSKTCLHDCAVSRANCRHTCLTKRDDDCLKMCAAARTSCMYEGQEAKDAVEAEDANAGD